MARKGRLESARHGRRSRYRIRTHGARDGAPRRIEAPQASGQWNGNWTLALTPPAMLAPARARTLRSALFELGYRPLIPGLLARPAGNAAALDAILGRCDARALRELVAGQWSVPLAQVHYRDFIVTLRPCWTAREASSCRARATPSCLCTLLLHAYRQAQSHDPLLPPELMAPPAARADVYAIYRALNVLCFVGADQ